MSIEVVESLLTSPWAYLLIFSIAALDAVIPAVPSEATVISAGVLAGTGELSLVAVVSAGAAGALIGDTTAYGAGRLMSERAVRWLQRSARGRRESERAARLLDRRGPLVIVTARFVPGGRTAATFTAGVVRYHPRRFVGWAAVAAAVWASYAALAGYLGGQVFEERPVLALALAFGLAAALVVAVEAVHRLRAHRSSPTEIRASGVAPGYGYPYGGNALGVPPSGS
jgi:membrane-associated protein